MKRILPILVATAMLVGWIIPVNAGETATITVTVLFDSLQVGTSDTFGLKLWIPRYLSTTEQQQFEIYIKAYSI